MGYICRTDARLDTGKLATTHHTPSQPEAVLQAHLREAVPLAAGRFTPGGAAD
jgi:hypothetical protein